MRLLHSRNAKETIVQLQQKLLSLTTKTILPMVFLNTERVLTSSRGFPFTLGGGISSQMSSPFFCPLPA